MTINPDQNKLAEFMRQFDLVYDRAVALRDEMKRYRATVKQYKPRELVRYDVLVFGLDQQIKVLERIISLRNEAGELYRDIIQGRVNGPQFLPVLAALGTVAAVAVVVDRTARYFAQLRDNISARQTTVDLVREGVPVPEAVEASREVEPLATARGDGSWVLVAIAAAAGLLAVSRWRV